MQCSTKLPCVVAQLSRQVFAKKQSMCKSPLNEVYLGASGEYGELLVRDGPLLDKEQPLSVSAAEVVGLLESLLNRPGLQPQCRNYTLTALMKLSTRFPDQADRIKVRAASCSCVFCAVRPPSVLLAGLRAAGLSLVRMIQQTLSRYSQHVTRGAGIRSIVGCVILSITCKRCGAEGLEYKGYDLFATLIM